MTVVHSRPTSLENLLRQVAEKSTFDFVTITNIEILELKSEVALLFANFLEADSFSGSTARTYGVIIKTFDGGMNWRITLNTGDTGLSSTDGRGTGSIMIDESFLLRNDFDDNISNLWVITQWAIEATFPTLYWSIDGGESWQESDAVGAFLASKGHTTFNYAEGLRFRNENEGVVIAKAQDSETSIYFLQTSNGGKKWEEILSIPSWYFAVRNAKNSHQMSPNRFQIVNDKRVISVMKLLDSFPEILKVR
jgi:photosystem II stability/assembly factor-like uncharacterized protein